MKDATLAELYQALEMANDAKDDGLARRICARIDVLTRPNILARPRYRE